MRSKFQNIAVAIIDDEKDAREVLKDCLEKSSIAHTIIGEANSVATGVQLVKECKPELIFLDISMPDGSGFDMLQELSEVDFDIIFTTAYDNFAIRAIKVAAIDYLLKPIDAQEVNSALSKYATRAYATSKEHINLLYQQFSPNNDSISRIAVPSTEGLDIVKVTDIIYLEAERNYTTLYILEKKVLVASKNIKEFEFLLPENRFIRVHHKYLVNLDHIKKYYKGRGGSLLMVNGQHIEVSRNRKNELMNALR